MKKPPKRLVIKPGRYRTRNGDIAEVFAPGNASSVYVWSGAIEGYEMSWTKAGRVFYDGEKDKGDLMERIAFKPAKRERLEWCVVLWCADKKRAQSLPDMLLKDGYIGYAPHLMQLPVSATGLPMLPATRKEKS